MNNYSTDRLCAYGVILFAILFLLGFTRAEIKSDNELYSISLELAEQPRVGNNTLTLIVRDGKTNNVIKEKLTIEVVSWMPVHEHGSATDAVVTSQGEGKYLVETVNFSMPGLWQIHLRITRGGKEETALFEVEVVPSQKKPHSGIKSGPGGLKKIRDTA